MGIQRVRQYQRLEVSDDLKVWAKKHMEDHTAEATLRIQDFDHNRLANLHQGVETTDSPSFAGLTISGSGTITVGGLTASKPVFTNSSKALVSTGTLGYDQGGTGLAVLGTANQMLGVNGTTSGLEYKTFTAGTGIQLTHAVQQLTIATTGLEPTITAGTTAQYWRGDKTWQTFPVILPTGAIVSYGGATAPTGFLLCDGTSYLRATYAALFAIIGTTYGSADADHFNVPDIQSKYPRGKGGALSLGDTGGGETHTHKVNPPSTTTGGTTADKPIGAGANDATADYHTHTVDIAEFDSGSGDSLDPYVVVNYIIKI